MIFLRLMLIHTLLCVQTNSLSPQNLKLNLFLDYGKALKSPPAVQRDQKMMEIFKSYPTVAAKKNNCGLQSGHCTQKPNSYRVGAPMIDILAVLSTKADTALRNRLIFNRRENKPLEKDVWKNLLKSSF